MNCKAFSHITPFVALILLLTLLPGGVPCTAAQSQPVASAVFAPDRARVPETLRSGPVMFIEDMGQFDERARFQVWGGPGTMWLTKDAIWVTVVGRGEASQPETVDEVKPWPFGEV